MGLPKRPITTRNGVQGKICTRCDLWRALTDYVAKSVGGPLKSHCRFCGRKESQKHYSANKDYYTDRNAEVRAARADVMYHPSVAKLLLAAACSKCGDKNAPGKRFTGTEDRPATFSVRGAAYLGYSETTTLAEAQQQDVVCQDCVPSRLNENPTVHDIALVKASLGLRTRRKKVA